MLLEYFQMIDRVVALDRQDAVLEATAQVPGASPVFEGHFPGMPLVPGVLLIETMAQASGLLVLAVNGLSAMPFLVSVDAAKLRGFVEPGAQLAIEAALEHDGSGFAAMRGRIAVAGRTVAEARMKLKTLAFSEVPLEALVRRKAADVGLLALMDAAAAPAGTAVRPAS